MAYDFIKWLGHSSFLFEDNGKVVYIDPFRLKGQTRKADVIFITHPHYDHLNMDDIKRIATPSTRILVPRDSVGKLRGYDVIGVAPGEEHEVFGMKVSVVPAYNVVRERLDKHPKAKGWVGYIITTNGKRVYHAGDTDDIPELGGISADLALLPMGGTYVMDVDETISASRRVKAVSIAPIHYRMLLGEKGSKDAEEKFLGGVKNGIILEEDSPSYSF